MVFLQTVKTNVHREYACTSQPHSQFLQRQRTRVRATRICARWCDKKSYRNFYRSLDFTIYSLLYLQYLPYHIEKISFAY